MLRSTPKFKVSKLKKMYDEKSLIWNDSVQRTTGSWSREQKSQFIHSMLTPNFYIPSLCFIRKVISQDENNTSDASIYSVIDGKQRLSVVFEFLNDEFCISKTTPNIIYEDKEVVIAGKKFSKLSKALQMEIKNYVFEISSIEECTEEEKEQLFFRLNSGTPLTKVQKSRATMGGDTAAFVNKLLEAKFWDSCKLSKLQKSKEENLTVLLQSMMIIDEDFTWAKIGSKDIEKYSEHLKENFPIKLQVKIKSALDFLGECFEEKSSFLKKINIPMIIYAASECIKYDTIKPEEFMSWYEGFTNENPEGDYATEIETYKSFCGESSINSEKVKGRLDTIYKSMNRVLKLEKKDVNTEILDNVVLEYMNKGARFINLE